MPVAKDVTNQKFGRLTALYRTGEKTVHGLLWECKCDCGNRAVVVLSRLVTGHTRSCGCLFKEALSKPSNMSHGHTRAHNKATSWEYHVWSTMKQRCLNPNNASYDRYGGRGIKVHPSWSGKDGYINFLSDMGHRPSAKHSIDRIDHNGDYGPDNCKWSTSLEQQNNRSGTRKITAFGKTMTSAAWSRETGVKAVTIRNRIDCGWDAEKAVTQPAGPQSKRNT